MSDPKPKTQAEAAARAMEMKESITSDARPGAGRTSSEGMNPLPDSDVAPSGAFDAEGQRPVLERSRKAR